MIDLIDVKEMCLEVRQKAGWTQNQLADHLGVNLTTIWRWETSKVFNIKLDKFQKLQRLHEAQKSAS